MNESLNESENELDIKDDNAHKCACDIQYENLDNQNENPQKSQSSIYNQILPNLTNSQKQEDNISKIFNTLEEFSNLFLAKFLKIQEYLDFPKISLSLFYSILDDYTLAGQLNNNQFISLIKKLYKLKLSDKVTKNFNNTSSVKSSCAINTKTNSTNDLVKLENLNRRNTSKSISNNQLFTEKFKLDCITNRLNNSSTNIFIEDKLNFADLPRFKDEQSNKDNLIAEAEQNKKTNEIYENVLIENFDNKLELNCFSESVNLNTNFNGNTLNNINNINHDEILSNFNNQIEKTDSNNTIPIELTNNINIINENKNNYESLIKEKEKEKEIKIDTDNLSCNISMSKDEFIIKENKDYYNKSNNNANFTTPFKGAGENISAFMPVNNINNLNNNLTLSFNSCLLSNNNNIKNSHLANLNSNFSYKKLAINRNYDLQNNTKYIKNKTFCENTNFILSKKASLLDTDAYDKISNLLKYFKSFSNDEYLFEADFIFACLNMFFEATFEERFLLVIKIFGTVDDINFEKNNIENNKEQRNTECENNKEVNNSIAFDKLVYLIYNFVHFTLHFSNDLKSKEFEAYPELSTQIENESENSDLGKTKSDQNDCKNNINKSSFSNNKKNNPTEKALNLMLENQYLMKMCESLVENFYDIRNKNYQENLDFETLIEFAESLI